MAIYASLDVYVNNPDMLKTTGKIKKRKSEPLTFKGEQVPDYSTKVLAVSLATAAYVNSKVGQYTGNKIRQSNIQQGLTIAGIGVSALINPYLAAVSAIAYTTKGIVDYAIRVTNAQQEAEFKRSYRGKMTTSGSRWRSNT